MAAPFALDGPFLLDEPTATRISLVRHGQQDRPQGPVFIPGDWDDLPLSELGRRQAQAVGEALADTQVDVVASSRLVRAHDTALQIAKHHGLEPLLFDGLREVDMYKHIDANVDPAGLMSQEEWDDVRTRYRADPRWDIVGFGETGEHLQARVVPVIEALIQQYQGKHVVVVFHGGSMNAYLAHILKWHGDLLFLPAHASISDLRARGDRRVIGGLNDRRHLAGIETY